MITRSYSTVRCAHHLSTTTVMASISEESIPIIDFASFLNGTEDQKISTAKQIKDAFHDVGFVYLTNHGVPKDKLEEGFSWVSDQIPSSLTFGHLPNLENSEQALFRSSHGD